MSIQLRHAVNAKNEADQHRGRRRLRGSPHPRNPPHPLALPPMPRARPQAALRTGAGGTAARGGGGEGCTGCAGMLWDAMGCAGMGSGRTAAFGGLSWVKEKGSLRGQAPGVRNAELSLGGAPRVGPGGTRLMSPGGSRLLPPGLLRCRRFVLCLFSRLFSAERWGFSLLKARAGLGVTGAHAAPLAEGDGGDAGAKPLFFLYFLKLYYDIYFFPRWLFVCFSPPPSLSF